MHQEAILLQEDKECREPTEGLLHDEHNFNLYLNRLHRPTRTHIKLPYTDKAIEEYSDDDDTVDVYNAITRGRHSWREVHNRATWYVTFTVAYDMF